MDLAFGLLIATKRTKVLDSKTFRLWSFDPILFLFGPGANAKRFFYKEVHLYPWFICLSLIVKRVLEFGSSKKNAPDELISYLNVWQRRSVGVIDASRGHIVNVFLMYVLEEITPGKIPFCIAEEAQLEYIRHRAKGNSVRLQTLSLVILLRRNRSRTRPLL